MTAVVKFGNANLPAVATLAQALRKVSSEIVGSGDVLLKMDKTGTWVFGADQTEVQEGSRWAVNPFSFTHGFIAWGEGEVLAEKTVPITQPLPEVDAAPAAAKRGWETQVGMSLKCLNGEDEGLDARYNVTSLGGKKAVQSLAVAIAEQCDRDPSQPVPVVELKKDHYQHKSYGRVYTPVFEVVGWISMDGPSEDAAEAAPEAAPAAEPVNPPVRRRRAVA